jgi:hypothetical protein
MKVHLLHRDRDFDVEQTLPERAETVARDLDLATLLGAMSRGDRLVEDVATKALLGARPGLDAISHRQ